MSAFFCFKGKYHENALLEISWEKITDMSQKKFNVQKFLTPWGTFKLNFG
jgi:hypothetical protein